MTENAPRTPHPEDPAEGADTPGQEQGGRTPHPDQPAEGTEQAAAEGVDPDNRVSGA